jgi:hypothetical protein
MSSHVQECVAFAIVGAVGLVILVELLRKHGAEPLSRRLLKQGRVKLAMRVRGWIK